MSDDSKLDIIIDKLEDAAESRKEQTKCLAELTIDTRTHFVDDRAFMAETRSEAARMNARLVNLETARDAETTQKLRALADVQAEPATTRIGLWRGFLALLISVPVLVLLALLTSAFMHWFGWK